MTSVPTNLHHWRDLTRWVAKLSFNQDFLNKTKEIDDFSSRYSKSKTKLTRAPAFLLRCKQQITLPFLLAFQPQAGLSVYRARRIFSCAGTSFIPAFYFLYRNLLLEAYDLSVLVFSGRNVFTSRPDSNICGPEPSLIAHVQYIHLIHVLDIFKKKNVGESPARPIGARTVNKSVYTCPSLTKIAKITSTAVKKGRTKVITAPTSELNNSILTGIGAKEA